MANRTSSIIHNAFHWTGSVRKPLIRQILETRLAPANHVIAKPAAPSVKVIDYNPILFLFTSYGLNAVLIANLFLRDDICLKKRQCMPKVQVCTHRGM